MKDIEFSLCAIYKNEEKNLETFLKRHQGMFEEMILVDTGSTDRSNEITRSYGVPYHFFQWVNDFSIARNYSLTKATKPFIIVLDIDEYVPPGEFEKLKGLMREKQKDVYSLVQVNFTNKREDQNWKSVETLPADYHSVAGGYIPSRLFRVFRNFRGVSFHGVIHELVGESVAKAGLSSAVTDTPIYHYGWIGEGRTEEEKRNKEEAYKGLIKKAWETDQSPKMAFYYIKTLDDPKERIRFSYKMIKQYPEVKQFWEIIAGNTVDLGQWQRALTYVEKGLVHHPENFSLLGTRVRCLNELGRPSEALAIVEELLKGDKGNPAYWYEKFRSLVMLNRKEEARALIPQFPAGFPEGLIKELSKMV
ncbi:MAG: glycosyltransferase [bacterium]|nr:glycosyltransferase [bacterium]